MTCGRTHWSRKFSQHENVWASLSFARVKRWSVIGFYDSWWSPVNVFHHLVFISLNHEFAVMFRIRKSKVKERFWIILKRVHGCSSHQVAAVCQTFLNEDEKKKWSEENLKIKSNHSGSKMAEVSELNRVKKRFVLFLNVETIAWRETVKIRFRDINMRIYI